MANSCPDMSHRLGKDFICARYFCSTVLAQSRNSPVRTRSKLSVQLTSLRSSIIMFFTPAAKLAIVWVFFFSAHALAQDSPGRFEVGGNFTAAHASFFYAYGPGVEGTVNFGRHIALDAALDWLPTDHPDNVTLGLFGLKVGTRTKHFGFFGKARPGFISFSKVLRDSTIIVDPEPPAVTLGTSAHVIRQTERAFDLGGVMEYYPARHWAMRWDVGDMLVFQEPGPKFTSIFVGQPPSILIFPAHTTQNFQFSTGVHYRF
jgi:Outer membrane protein beta-barrel domain